MEKERFTLDRQGGHLFCNNTRQDGEDGSRYRSTGGEKIEASYDDSFFILSKI